MLIRDYVLGEDAAELHRHLAFRDALRALVDCAPLDRHASHSLWVRHLDGADTWKYSGE